MLLPSFRCGSSRSWLQQRPPSLRRSFAWPGCSPALQPKAAGQRRIGRARLDWGRLGHAEFAVPVATVVASMSLLLSFRFAVAVVSPSVLARLAQKEIFPPRRAITSSARSCIERHICKHLFMKVLVHPLHSAPQTDQEGLAGFALHWGPLLKPLLQPGPEPLHDIKVRAAFGEVLLHSETLFSSCRNRVCIPKTRLMILDQMHDLRHATAIAGTLIR